MRNRLPLVLAIVLAILCISGLTFFPQYQAPKPISPPEGGEGNIHFVPNLGQWEGPAAFRADLGRGYLWMEETAWVYHFWVPPMYIQQHAAPRYFGVDRLKSKDSTEYGHVLKVDFVGAQSPKMVPDKAFSSYRNFFIGNDKSRWKGNVPEYGMVTYEQLWPGIDLRVYSYGEAIKYDFVVAPGVDPNLIRLHFDGADKLSIEDGELVVKTSVRTLTELPPVAYQEEREGREGIACRFALDGSTLHFELPKGYDKDRPLIIDPTLVFSTFSGSTDDNWGFTAAYDTAGSMYAGGILWHGVGAIPGATTGYPTTTGAYATQTNGGTFEVTISKFDPTGANLIYATLLGGDNDDRPHSLIINDAGELYVYGRTLSGNFPTENAFDSTQNGDADIFVAKFNAAGSQLLASTYVGGADDDGINENATFTAGPVTKYNYGDDARGEVLLDYDGDVYVASCTKSIDFPADTFTFQPNNYGGPQDGVVFKMTPDLDSMIWGSYLGGTGTDAAYGLAIDSAKTVYVTGGTNSTNILVNLPGTGGRNPNYLGGRADGFVVHIDAQGRNLLHGTYIGTNDYDQAFFIQKDESNNIYLAGQTEGRFPIANAIYRDVGAKQFIIKLTPDLATTVYSTTFGDTQSSTPNISPTAMLVDNCENVYVTGWGGVTNYQGTVRNMPLTTDAQQDTTDGSDFYLFVLARNADSMLYATYLGGINPLGGSGEHVDGGTSRFDKRGIVYHAVCANCGGITVPGTTLNQSFPSTVGAYSVTNNSPNCNLAAFKFDFGLTGINANFITLDSSNNPISGNTLEGCPPLTVKFDNVSSFGANARYFWEFGIVGSSDSTFEPTFIFQNPGTYTIRLIIEDSTSCNIRDTAFQIITVYPYPLVEAGRDEVICQGDSARLEATGSGDFLWEPAIFTSPPNQAITDVFPPGNTEFIVTLTDTNGCIIKDSLIVQVDSANWLDLIPGDTTICAGQSLDLQAFAPSKSVYFWEPARSFDNPRLSNPIATLDSTRTLVVTVVDTNRCTATDSLEVIVYHSSAGGDTSICAGASTSLFATGGSSYRWEPAQFVSGVSSSNPIVTVNQTTIFSAFVTLPNGCVDTHYVEVQAYALPELTLSDPDTICDGASSLLSVSGGASHVWSPAVFLDDSTANRPLATPPATMTFSVIATSVEGCVSDTSLELFVREQSLVDAGPDRQVCGEGETSLQGSGATNYQWAPSFGLNNSTIARPTVRLLGDEVTYFLTGIDRYGCEGTDSVQVRRIEQPVTSILEELFPCDRESRASLTALGGERVRWSDGSRNRTRIVTPIPGGTMLIATAFIDDCAGVPDTVVIDQRDPFPIAAFTASPTAGIAPIDVQFTNQSEKATRYEWFFGEGMGQSQQRDPLWGYVAGTWRPMLIAYSSENCPDTAYLDLFYENASLHIPSAFTPNNDNVNDFFYIQSYGLTAFSIRIYNRWGVEIFASESPDFRWDGTYQGDTAPEGVYVYQIITTSPTGRRETRTGTVTVLR
ncbi:MAG: gliding motility-associated C-terminal domain-containing protein [Bacteroidia bacterium]